MVQSSQGFQSQVNVQPAPAVEGDFASTNPRFSTLAGPGGFIAGAAGVRIGYFAWAASVFPGGAIGPGSFDGQDSNGFPAIVSNTGTGPVTGFVHREQQGLNTTFLAEAGMQIPSGYGLTLMSGGDFWVKNNGTNTAVQGMKAYATFLNGQATFNPTGQPTTGSFTGSIGPQVANFSASISGNVMTVTGVANGTIVAGGLVTGGTGVVPGTAVASQISGTTGGVGLYTVTIGDQNVANAALAENYGLLTVGTNPIVGTIGIGVTLTGTTTPLTAGTYVSQLGTGTGGAGTYFVNNSQTVGSETMTFALNVETKWICMSTGNTGELVKISDHALG